MNVNQPLPPLLSEELPRRRNPSVAALLANVTWSYSRRTALEQCPRRYYYFYYGSSMRTASGEPHKAQLRFLKGVSNRHERAGQILHHVIATALRGTQVGEVWSPRRLSELAFQLFSRDCEYSGACPAGDYQRSGRFGPVLLREFHYRNPAARQLCAETLDRLLDAVNTFATSLACEEFRRAGGAPGALIEHRVRIPGLPCQVDGRVDLAYVANGKIIVVDWKLGDEESGDDSLQLVAYALWASQLPGAQSRNVGVYKVFLGTGRVVQFPLTDKMLMRGRVRIVQDAERMAALDGYGRAGIADAFPTCARVRVCGLCPFQKVCPDGSVFLNAGD